MRIPHDNREDLMISLISFLGNPGKQYELTRHNIPWLLMRKIEDIYFPTWQYKYKGAFFHQIIKGNKIIFHKPLTYMNKSGEAVQSICRYFRIQNNSIMIVHDHVDLPFGTIKISYGGGLYGHKGLRSIGSMLGTKNFYRCSMGISRPNRQTVSSWVLGSFKEKEMLFLSQYLETTAQYILGEEIINGETKSKILKITDPP
jgi:peptidyl-tRNA hydrolase, PTH1 family